ncbi:shikimate dehydrogenase [Legionella yabuuchiae]|uniref:shikimate dehydrogenase n=1 Tax=Legionella yabuuchiae TaxID=376727 RepID=UPI001056CE70|nr:shikimate dehydrogenase [Legionella yabuuchiae]
MTDMFAVMGNPIAHSLSPVIHQQFAAQTGQRIMYEKKLIQHGEFEQQVVDFFNSGGKGLNITLPFKTKAYALCEVRTERAEQAQAVNTLWMRDGNLHGDNTDGVGLLRDLGRYLIIRNKSVLLLGAGGAASGVISALLSQTPKVTVVNRTRSKAESLQARFEHLTVLDFESLDSSYDLIINATSASLDDKTLPIPASVWDGYPFCYDLSYRMACDTPFVALAKAHGCDGIDGLGMLVEQAAESFWIWLGIKPEVQPVLTSLKKSRDDRFRS